MRPGPRPSRSPACSARAVMRRPRVHERKGAHGGSWFPPRSRASDALRERAPGGNWFPRKRALRPQAEEQCEVPKVGIEPTLPGGNRILSPARLPVPPLRLEKHRSRSPRGRLDFRKGHRGLLQPGLDREILAHSPDLSSCGHWKWVTGGGTVSRKFSLLAFVGAAVVVAAVAAGYSGSARSATRA